MDRISSKFSELKKQNKKAFIAFITAGYPDLGITEKLILEFDRIGVDIVEIGVPFSDPMADGPLIQEASRQALKKGVNLNHIFALVARIRRSGSQIPIALMTYYNPVFCFGEEKFFRRARLAGVDGVIVPDLPPEEAKTFIKFSNIQGIGAIFFLAPTSSLGRVKFISQVSKGFIYYVSLTGVTGPRERLPADLAVNIREIKKHTAKPVCAGFGVSDSAQVKQIYKFADGVIVGSAIIKKIQENIGKTDLIKKVSSFVSNLIAV